MKWAFKHQDLQRLDLKTGIFNFQPLEVVGCDSETQLQVGKEIKLFNLVIWR